MTDEVRKKIHRVTNKINNDILFLWDKYDWGDITIGFDEEAMTELLCNIEGENELKYAIVGISQAWKEALEHNDPICYDSNGWSKYNNDFTIEYVLDKITKKRYYKISVERQKGFWEPTHTELSPTASDDVMSAETDIQINNDITIVNLLSRINELETELKLRDERISGLLKEREQRLDFSNDKWIGCFDGFLKPNLNPQAIAEALKNINHPNFPKNERGYWWVFITVLTEIHWEAIKNHKLVLQWANLHFNCGWDWTKDNQFKFTDIKKEIRSNPSSKWNKQLIGNLVGDYYAALAKTMKNVFVDFLPNGKMFDKSKFIKEGFLRINDR